MDSVYQVVEGLQFFIPIIAVVVVCGALFFWIGAPDEDEYLHSALDIKLDAAKLQDEMREDEKKKS